MLKLKPATQRIGGKQTQCYGVFFGDYLIEEVPALRYDDYRKYVSAANQALSATGKSYTEGMARLVYFQAKDIFRAGSRNKAARAALGVA